MKNSVDVVGLGWNAKFNPKIKAANMLQNIKISNIIFMVLNFCVILLVLIFLLQDF